MGSFRPCYTVWAFCLPTTSTWLTMFSWESLPIETWSEILYFVASSGLENLAMVCETCSQLMSIARPMLYRDLTLKTSTEGIEPNLSAADTFSLLARDVDLARSVRTLTLDAAAESEFEITDTPILVHTASLKNMSLLKRLTILGNVFREADDDMKAEFIEALCCLPVKELHFPSPFCFYPFSPDQFGRIVNLKSIECYSQIDYHGESSCFVICIFLDFLPRGFCPTMPTIAL
jgi:hypothetical protein